MLSSVLSHLPKTHPWREHIIWFDSIDSTNTHAKALAAAGAPHGTILLAGHQTQGRGRMGRSFHSPESKGIYLSVILRPDCPPAGLMHLTCAAGTAMCDAVEAVCGIRPGVKWINDLVLRRRKVGGILTELALRADGTVDHAVVGIGINCSQSAGDFPEDIAHIAGSLAMLTGKEVDRALLAAEMIRALQSMSTALLTDKKAILSQYRSDCVTLGKQVRLMGNRTDRGYALDVDEDGALIVGLHDGSVTTVQSGEVSVRGLYGYSD